MRLLWQPVPCAKEFQIQQNQGTLGDQEPLLYFLEAFYYKIAQSSKLEQGSNDEDMKSSSSLSQYTLRGQRVSLPNERCLYNVLECAKLRKSKLLTWGIPWAGESILLGRINKNLRDQIPLG